MEGEQRRVRSVGLPEERKEEDRQKSSDGNKGGFVQKLPEMEMGAELNRRKGEGLDGAGVAAAPIPVSLGEKGSFISSSGV